MNPGVGIGLGVGIGPSDGGGAAGFDPATLFTGSINGAWYDPSDKASLFQDTAGTVPVTASGDPVARMNDKSGNGHHILQSTNSKRPIYTESGALRYLQFTKTNNTYMEVGETGFLLAHPNEIALALRIDSIVGTTHLYDGFSSHRHVMFTTGDGNFLVWPNQTTNINVPLATATDYCLVNRHNGNAASYNRKNGVQTNGGVDPTMDLGGLRLGAFLDGQAQMTARLYGFIVRDTLFSASELAAIETYLGAKAGLTL